MVWPHIYRHGAKPACDLDSLLTKAHDAERYSTAPSADRLRTVLLIQLARSAAAPDIGNEPSDCAV